MNKFNELSSIRPLDSNYFHKLCLNSSLTIQGTRSALSHLNVFTLYSANDNQNPLPPCSQDQVAQ